MIALLKVTGDHHRIKNRKFFDTPFPRNVKLCLQKLARYGEQRKKGSSKMAKSGTFGMESPSQPDFVNTFIMRVTRGGGIISPLD